MKQQMLFLPFSTVLFQALHAQLLPLYHQCTITHHRLHSQLFHHPPQFHHQQPNSQHLLSQHHLSQLHHLSQFNHLNQPYQLLIPQRWRQLTLLPPYQPHPATLFKQQLLLQPHVRQTLVQQQPSQLVSPLFPPLSPM